MPSSFFDFHDQVRRRPASTSTPVPSGAAAPPAPASLTVSQLTNRIERVLRSGIPEVVHVRGELSNYKPHPASGHLYFTMKDADSCIDCVMWKADAARLKFQPTAGMELLAGGNVRIYGKQGKYQISVTSLRPLGKGALELAFQQLRAKLEREGLFATDRKKPLPPFPRTIVLVTGAGTAALQDMLKVLRRYAWIRLLVYPVPVQGDGAAARIAAALTHLNQRGESLRIDLILLARGGGSLEDLWAFNEEAVARAVAASQLPIVTGIGHEVDTSIADLIADYHAHTPTEAAQIVTAHWRDARDEIDSITLRLRRIMQAMLETARQRLRGIERHETFRRPMDAINGRRQLLDDRQRALLMALTHRLHSSQRRLQEMHTRLDRHMPAALRRLRERIELFQQKLTVAATGRIRRSADQMGRLATKFADSHPRHRLELQRQRLASLADRLDRAARGNLLNRRQGLDALARQLEAVGPENVLRRGYTITFRKKDGAMLRAAAQVKAGDRLVTRTAEGQVESTADDPKQPTLF